MATITSGPRRLQPPPTERRPTPAPPATADPARIRAEYAWLAAGLAIASATIHLSVAPAHLREYRPFGVMFVIAATIQLGLSFQALRSRSERVLRALFSCSLLIVIGWLWSRTIGFPLGPTPWVAEQIRPVDLTAAADELLTCALIAAFLRPPKRQALRWVLIAGETAGLVAIVASFVLVASGAGHHS
jgi:hypothetical protein